MSIKDLFFCTVSLLSLTIARADTYTIPETNITITYSLSGSPAVAAITGCNKDAKGVLVIPVSLGGAPVKAIGKEAFYECISLSSVTIPEGVTSIGFAAFAKCYDITSLMIPQSVTVIDEAAFHSCISLTNATIPDGVTSIGGGTFAGCERLKKIVLGKKVTSIGELAFSACVSLRAVTFPEGLTMIGNDAFALCESLMRLTFPKSVRSIGNAAFSDCEELTIVTFEGNAPTTIGDEMFAGAAIGLKIYFYKGAQGFTSPEWQGYPCEVIVRPE